MAEEQRKILIIDDEPDALDMITEFLSKRNFEIVTALDGEEGLKKFNDESPSVVVCDIRMPKKDGFQFLGDLRNGKEWVPVIILSALTDPSAAFQSYRLEADYYLTKPVNLPDLLKAIEIMFSLIPLRKK